MDQDIEFASPQKFTARAASGSSTDPQKKIALMYISCLPYGLVYGHSKLLYNWKKQVSCIFKCAKI